MALPTRTTSTYLNKTSSKERTSVGALAVRPVECRCAGRSDLVADLVAGLVR